MDEIGQRLTKKREPFLPNLEYWIDMTHGELFYID